MTEIVKKRRPELIKVGERSVSLTGFHMGSFLDHLHEHLIASPNGWCDMACGARTFSGRATDGNRALQRTRVRRAFKEFLKQEIFLAIEYAPRGGGHNGEIMAVKIYDPEHETGVARQHAANQLKRMLRRKQITESEIKVAQLLLGLPMDEFDGGSATAVS